VNLILNQFPSPEDVQNKFPHVVCHGIKFPGDEWRHMVRWLRSCIGEPGDAWCWLVSYQLRFKCESHAIQFAVTWSGWAGLGDCS
jgi:hypothetical protein